MLIQILLNWILWKIWIKKIATRNPKLDRLTRCLCRNIESVLKEKEDRGTRRLSCPLRGRRVAISTEAAICLSIFPVRLSPKKNSLIKKDQFLWVILMRGTELLRNKISIRWKAKNSQRLNRNQRFLKLRDRKWWGQLDNKYHNKMAVSQTEYYGIRWYSKYDSLALFLWYWLWWHIFYFPNTLH